MTTNEKYGGVAEGSASASGQHRSSAIVARST
jgi:hypothetical protein